MNISNPFKPTFGKNPPLVIGRERIINDYIDGLDEDAGDERRATLFIGQRGMGKTVILNQIAERAKAKGWVVAEASNNGTLLGDIVDELDEATSKKASRKLSGASLSVMGFGAGIETDAAVAPTPGWRMSVSKILDRAENIKARGVLFTIDEVHANSDELRQFATAYQHFVREDRNVGVAMAGLPNEVSELLQDKILTFLRRANKVQIGDVPVDQVELGLLQTIEANSRSIGSRALQQAASATSGYPYLIQLIGSYSWRVHPETPEISFEDVRIAIPQARAKLIVNVVEPMLKGLSSQDLEFLKAMAQDENESKMADIQAKLGVSQSYAAQYRKRLIEADVIHSPRRGIIAYTVPQTRWYFLK